MKYPHIDDVDIEVSVLRNEGSPVGVSVMHWPTEKEVVVIAKDRSQHVNRHMAMVELSRYLSGEDDEGR